MAKIALHTEGSAAPEILDTEVRDEHTWSVGRAQESDLWFRHPMVSKKHGLIRWDSETDTWQIFDQYSRNGIWRDNERIPPGRWVEMPPESQIDFGTPVARVIVSYDIDETLQTQALEEPTGQLSHALQQEPLTGPWYGAILADSLAWLRSPQTPIGAFYRWVILTTSGAVVSLMLWLWRQQ